jgi:hypothetical protein
MRKIATMPLRYQKRLHVSRNFGMNMLHWTFPRVAWSGCSRPCLIAALSCAALALNACSLLPHRTVNRYIVTYCLTHDQFEQLKAQEPDKIHNSLNGDAEHDIKLLAGGNVRLRSYSDGLLEVLGGCTDPNN